MKKIMMGAVFERELINESGTLCRAMLITLTPAQFMHNLFSNRRNTLLVTEYCVSRWCESKIGGRAEVLTKKHPAESLEQNPVESLDPNHGIWHKINDSTCGKREYRSWDRVGKRTEWKELWRGAGLKWAAWTRLASRRNIWCCWMSKCKELMAKAWPETMR